MADAVDTSLSGATFTGIHDLPRRLNAGRPPGSPWDVEAEMAVLWWLAPPLAATCLAMLWVTWLGRERDEARRNDSDAALLKMATALAKPAPSTAEHVVSIPTETSHGVAVRGSARRPDPTTSSTAMRRSSA